MKFKSILAIAAVLITGAVVAGAQTSDEACQAIYEEARTTQSCIAFEAYVMTCETHPLLPVAQLYLKRECAVGEAAVASPQTAPAPQMDMAEVMTRCQSDDIAAEASIAACTVLIAANPEAETVIEAYVYRARRYLRTGEDAKALTDAQEMLPLGVMDGKYAYVYELFLGTALYKLGRYPEALEAMNAATRDRAIDLLRASRAISIMEVGRTEEGLSLLRQIVFDPNADADLLQQAVPKLHSSDTNSPPFVWPYSIVQAFYGQDQMLGDALPEDARVLGPENPYIVPELARLLQLDYDRDYALMDFDPLVSGQDAQIIALKFEWQLIDDDGVPVFKVSAGFRNFDVLTRVDFIFVRDSNVWKLANVTTDEWDMMQILSSAPEPASSATVATPGSAAPYHLCDDLAAHPSDPAARGPGIEFSALNADAAISACVEAMNSFPNEPRFVYQLARAVDKKENFADAKRGYTLAAEAGYLRAMSSLATLYRNGQGTPKDLETALLWELRAAEGGYVIAMYNVGEALEDGDGSEVDEERAFGYYYSAAKEGYAPAMHKVGYFLSNGLGTPEDDWEARRWYSEAAEEGESSSMLNLALMLDQGQGGARNAEGAAIYLYAAVRMGHEATLERLTRTEPVFSAQVFRALQSELKAVGFYSGTIDGKPGPRTFAALRALSQS